MPENTESEVTAAPINTSALPAKVEITRGDKVFPYVKTQVKREGNLGKDASYLAPDKEFAYKNPQALIDFVGAKKIVSWALGKLKQNAQELFLAQIEAPNFDGTIDIEQFVKDVQGLSTRGESIKDLEERKNDIVDEMGELAEIKDISEDPENGISEQDRMLKFMEFTKELKEITASINAKRRPREEAAPALKAA